MRKATVPPAGYGNPRLPHYWRTCPTCEGTGINPVLPTRVCPKCRGEGKLRRGS